MFPTHEEISTLKRKLQCMDNFSCTIFIPISEKHNNDVLKKMSESGTMSVLRNIIINKIRGEPLTLITIW